MDFARGKFGDNRENIKGTGSHDKTTAGFGNMIRLKLSAWTHIITTDEVL